MSNKTQLQTNNTNLQALIDKANALPDAGSGGSGGGTSNAGEWIQLSSLPTTYIAEPVFGSKTYYYEVPEGCKAVVIRDTMGDCTISYKTSFNNVFNTTSLIYTMETMADISDADGSGSFLKIDVYNNYDNQVYLLPIYEA